MERRWYDWLASLSLILVLASFLPTVSAQSLDPNTVPLQTRATWCQGNTQACSLLCLQGTSANTCDPAALTYECTCSDGTSPDLANYALTLPYFICAELRSQCIANNANDLSGQQECNAVQCAGATPGTDSGGAVSTTSTTIPVSDQPSPTEGPGLNTETIPSVLDPSIQTVPERTSSISTTSSASTTSQSPVIPDITGQSSSTSSSASSSTRSLDPSTTSDAPGAGETGTGGSGDGGGKKGLSTAAIAGIAAGLGVPALLVLLFLVYKWGGRRAKDPPSMPPVVLEKHPQWQGGNEISGGGADPGIGHGNEVGGIEEGHYGSESRWNTGRQY